jgi:hypothetical protein
VQALDHLVELVGLGEVGGDVLVALVARALRRDDVARAGDGRQPWRTK